VVASQPQFGDAAELVVVGHHFGYEVAMIIDDGHFSRMIVEKVLCGFSLQQEVVVHEFFHK
jgi:hypothetical protein